MRRLKKPEKMSPEERKKEAEKLMDQIQSAMRRLSALTRREIVNFNVNPENKGTVMAWATWEKFPEGPDFPENTGM